MKSCITIFNVGVADAILICLCKDKETLLVLIDGGQISSSSIIVDAINSIIDSSPNPISFNIICTHSDSDHIEGLIPVINYFKNKISKIFVHQIPPQQLTKSIKNSILPSARDKVYGSIAQHKSLLNLAKDIGIQIIHPFGLKTINQSFPEFFILGPTEAYYNDIYQVKSDSVSEKEYLIDFDKINYIQQINDADRKLTKQNLSSIITMLNHKSGKFLFTGDAGVASFEHLPDYKNLLSDIYFLKVPHHGSIKNLSVELMDIMRPQISVITGLKSKSQHIATYLNNIGSEIYFTEEGNFEFSF